MNFSSHYMAAIPVPRQRNQRLDIYSRYIYRTRVHSTITQIQPRIFYTFYPRAVYFHKNLLHNTSGLSAAPRLRFKFFLQRRGVGALLDIIGLS